MRSASPLSSLRSVSQSVDRPVGGQVSSVPTLRYIFPVTQSFCEGSFLPAAPPSLYPAARGPLVGCMIHCELGLKVHCDVGSITDDWCNLQRGRESYSRTWDVKYIHHSYSMFQSLGSFRHAVFARSTGITNVRDCGTV